MSIQLSQKENSNKYTKNKSKSPTSQFYVILFCHRNPIAEDNGMSLKSIEGKRKKNTPAIISQLLGGRRHILAGVSAPCLKQSAVKVLARLYFH